MGTNSESTRWWNAEGAERDSVVWESVAYPGMLNVDRGEGQSVVHKTIVRGSLRRGQGRGFPSPGNGGSGLLNPGKLFDN